MPGLFELLAQHDLALAVADKDYYQYVVEGGPCIDTGVAHRLKSATVRAIGPIAKLGALKLSVNGVSAPAVVNGDQLTFTFSEPVEVPRAAATLVQLETGGALAAGAQPQLMLAGFGSLGAGVLLMMGGLGRRERWWLIAALVGVSLLSACGSRSDPADGSAGPGVKFELTALEFAPDAGADYSGLPLPIGEAKLP